MDQVFHKESGNVTLNTKRSGSAHRILHTLFPLYRHFRLVSHSDLLILPHRFDMIETFLTSPGVYEIKPCFSLYSWLAFFCNRL